MQILVLGSGAGGGFPQWNCNCEQCAGYRRGAVTARERTQSSIAVSADGRRWVLLNASPDIGTQLRQRTALNPQQSPRHSPFAGVVLMDAQIDHVTGLLGLREGPCIDLYATPCVFEDLTTGLPLLNVLQHYCGTRWHMLPVTGDQVTAEFEVAGAQGLRFTAVAIAGMAPPYSPHRREPVRGDNIALLIEDVHTGGRVFYSPGLAEVSDHEMQWLRRADVVMVDGTFWREDEMLRAGLSPKHASDMGHLPQQGQEGRSGMIDVLGALPARRKVLIHINNSNPILNEEGAERATLRAHGIEVAYDGMEIEL